MALVDLNEIVVFIKVAQLGSFSRAAEALNIPKSTVSTKVNHLEKRLGVALIRRTTRKVSLTQMGEQFYERCVENIQNLKNAEEEITFSKVAPSGTIKISAPVFLGSYFLSDVISEYKKLYPLVKIELVLTDRFVDLISEGIDIAIRTGELQDSIFVSKKIGATHFGLYASPAYLKKNPKINHPKDLKDHHCIQFSYLGKDKWTLHNSQQRQTITVPMKGDIIVDDISITKELVERDQGIAFLPAFCCAEGAKSKTLINILPDWRTETRSVHFIYPSSKFLLPKIKQFIIIAESFIKSRL